MSVLVAAQRLEAVRFRAVRAVPLADWRQLAYMSAGERKYGEPFYVAEEIKTALRRRYAQEQARTRTRGVRAEDFARRSREFWEEYEDVNRRLLPEDPVYSGTRQGIALSTTADLWTLTVGASGQHRILELFIAGEATASAVARVAVNRPSTAGATPTNQTPEKFSTRSPAAVSTFATAWTTQPTLAANDLITMTFNAFGGSDKFVPQPGAEIYQVNGEQVSSRSRSGTSTVSAHAIWEEL